MTQVIKTALQADLCDGQLCRAQQRRRMPDAEVIDVGNRCFAEWLFEKPAEVSISFVDNQEIKQLNAEFRSRDMETDVLSFPLGENGVFDKNEDTGAYMLGDIVISVEKAVSQAKLYGHSFQREMGFLTVHSMLHLLGYDHETGGLEAAKMREKEEMILS